ncbi:MAG: response regulator transcription factor [Ruminococcus sp.]|nr:response regulator transcription factor [Ruminococcus sp.]MBQ4283210.1 response regulator transcription factor [Lachnospira sp.]
MVEIIVCDDDINITEFLKFFIMKHFGDEYIVIAMNRCQELIGMVELNGRVPDILIMDINLKDGNGIETVKYLQALHPKLKVIYLTGIINYATAIFETNPAYFLVKPINENKLIDAITKVSKEIELDKYDSFVIKTNRSEIILYRRDIMYVESQGRKLVIHTSDGKKNEIYEKMDVIQEQLGPTFIRSHKSFLINMKYITERTNKEFYLSDGKVLPISKPNLKEAKIKFISYLGEE